MTVGLEDTIVGLENMICRLRKLLYYIITQTHMLALQLKMPPRGSRSRSRSPRRRPPLPIPPPPPPLPIPPPPPLPRQFGDPPTWAGEPVPPWLPILGHFWAGGWIFCRSCGSTWLQVDASTLTFFCSRCGTEPWIQVGMQ